MFLCFCLLSVESSAYWQEIMPDARSVAMGGSQVAIATGMNSAYWNPARLYKTSSFGLSTARVYGLYNYYYGSFGMSLFTGTLGISYTMNGVDGLQNTAYVNGRPALVQETTYANQMVVMTYADNLGRLWRNLGWSVSFLDELFMGANLKYFNNRIYDTTGNGLGVDLGLSYSLQKSLYLGVAVYNRLPININWSNGTSEIYPRRTRIGIGWQALVNLLLSADLEQSENQPATYYYGLEYWLTPSLALRGGYNQETYNLGVGLTVYQLTLDVAYSWPVDSNGLDPTFRLSAGKEW